MVDADWTSIFLKMASTALAVTVASTVAELAGPVWGALAASLPVSVGPAYIFLVIANDPAFVAESALSSCATNSATIFFLAVYVRLAARGNPDMALVQAITCWFVLVYFIHAMDLGPVDVLILNAMVFVLGIRLTRKSELVEAEFQPVLRSRFDLPIRAGIVAAFVALIVTLSSTLGPSVTGTLAAFPIVFIVTLAVLRRRIGGNACAVLAATALRAMGGFGLMLLVLAITIVPLGGTIALTLALLTTLSWSGGLILLNRLSQRKNVPKF